MKQLIFRWWWFSLLLGAITITGCSSDDEPENNEDDFVELSVFVVDNNTNQRLENAYVTIIQNGNELASMQTNSDGFFGINTYHGLKPGKITVEVELEEYNSYSEQINIPAGYYEQIVKLRKQEKSMTAQVDYAEDLYGSIKIFIPNQIPYVRVSEGMQYNPDNYSEYTSDGLNTTQYITYNNLVPETTYHFHVSAFNESGNIVNNVTLEFTTKPLYNISNATTSIVDFFAFYNGISLDLANGGQYYLVAYPKNQVPSEENKIKKDAIANGLTEWTTSIYATNLAPNTDYRVFCMKAERKDINSTQYSYYAPGKLVDIDVRTISKSNLTSQYLKKYGETKDYIQIDIEGCTSGYKGITITNYDQYENYPDVVLASLCYTKSHSTEDRVTYQYSDLTSWNGIVILPNNHYSSSTFTPAGTLLKAKFKYGTFYSYRNEVMTKNKDDDKIRYGGIPQELLNAVR